MVGEGVVALEPHLHAVAHRGHRRALQAGDRVSQRHHVTLSDVAHHRLRLELGVQEVHLVGVTQPFTPKQEDKKAED